MPTGMCTMSLAGGIPEDLPDALIEVEFFCGEVESSGLGFPGICLLLEGEVSALNVPFSLLLVSAILRPSFVPSRSRIQLEPDRSVAKLRGV